MDERIKKIADYYGYESQMDMLCEECGEFVQARNKLRRNVDGAYQNCLEEIADIAIMVEQMKLICGAERIEQIMNEKLDRQIQRIEAEREESMDEYISKQAILKHLNDCKEDPLFESDMARICFAIGIFIENMKAADVQPVKHGKWLSRCEGDIYDFSECSECGNIESCETPYCAQCGARMDGDSE